MTPARAPIALLTDFGVSDGYVAAMKGVLLARLSEATLVDVTHAVPPGEIARAAFVLEEVAGHFPAGTAFLVVVDPGVGSDRRPLAVSAGGRFFVGPDNGVLTPALRLEDAVVRVIEPSRVGAASITRTFHGRDLFAPAAAYLAGGGGFLRLGRAITDPVRLPERAVQQVGRTLQGRVVYVDRFGNCITNVRESDLRSFCGEAEPSSCTIRVGNAVIAAWVGTYADALPGAACALLGSTGRLEIALREGHAALRLGVHEGDKVTIQERDAGY